MSTGSIHHDDLLVWVNFDPTQSLQLKAVHIGEPISNCGFSRSTRSSIYLSKLITCCEVQSKSWLNT
eukprot:8438450-Heterocapsa_arctica.AAC.1